MSTALSTYPEIQSQINTAMDAFRTSYGGSLEMFYCREKQHVGSVKKFAYLVSAFVSAEIREYKDQIQRQV